MVRVAKSIALMLLATVAVLAAPFGDATVQRTFVSSHGQDTNACTLTAPCRSFGTALSQTTAGGEIIVLDSAGYGQVVITQSVSIIAPPGIYAGVSVLSGTGILVQGFGIVVRLRGLTINGLGGSIGIQFLPLVPFPSSNMLFVEDCTVSNMMNIGFQAAAEVTAIVSRSRFNNNADAGIEARNGATVTVTDTEVARSYRGMFARSDTDGVTTTLRVTNSTVTDSYFGIHAGGLSNLQKAQLVATGNTIAGSYFGIAAGCACTVAGVIEALVTGNNVSASTYGLIADGAGATMVLSRNAVSNNTYGLSATNGGSMLTLSDNVAERNATDASGLTQKNYH